MIKLWCGYFLHKGLKYKWRKSKCQTSASPGQVYQHAKDVHGYLHVETANPSCPLSLSLRSTAIQRQPKVVSCTHQFMSHTCIVLDIDLIRIADMTPDIYGKMLNICSAHY